MSYSLFVYATGRATFEAAPVRVEMSGCLLSRAPRFVVDKVAGELMNYAPHQITHIWIKDCKTGRWEGWYHDTRGWRQLAGSEIEEPQ